MATRPNKNLIRLPSDQKTPKGRKPPKEEIREVLALLASFRPFGFFWCRQSWTKYIFSLLALFSVAALIKVFTLNYTLPEI